MNNARIKAGWILGSTALGMSVVIGIWFLTDPVGFLPDRLGINGQALDIPWAWVLAIVIAIGYAAFTVKSVPLVNRHKFELSPLKLIGIWAALVSGIVEEVVFRKLLMDYAMSLGMNVVVQVALSATLFGLAHALWGLLAGEGKVVIPTVIATTILGGMLAVLYLVAGRNVLPAVVSHALINLVIEPWLILAAVSGTFIAGKKPTQNA